MTLTGVGCRLQTCSRLASERFDSAFCAFNFDSFMPGVLSTAMTKASGSESIKSLIYSVKEQCQEEFAVLGQFCAKIISLRLKS